MCSTERFSCNFFCLHDVLVSQFLRLDVIPFVLAAFVFCCFHCVFPVLFCTCASPVELPGVLSRRPQAREVLILLLPHGPVPLLQPDQEEDREDLCFVFCCIFYIVIFFTFFCPKKPTVSDDVRVLDKKGPNRRRHCNNSSTAAFPVPSVCA